MTLGRAPLLATIAAVLLVGGLVDRTGSGARPPARPAEEASAMPTSAPATALSSTWYCAGATATAAGTSAASVIMANPRSQPTRGAVTIVPTAGPPRTVPVEVAPFSVAEVGLGALTPSAAAAAVVDLQSGEVAATLATFGGQDFDVTPCASAGSERWYFADGSTARDASLSLSLFNPFPEDAIADLAFSTEQGRAVPADLQGVVIPARSLVVKEITEHVRRREAVATALSLRTGRVVAAQSMGRTAPGRVGASVALGAPSPAPLWYFPDGLVAATVAERYSLFNPGPREAEVSLEVSLDEGGAEPFEITVPAGDRVTIALNEESRIPKGVGHSATVRSVDGVPVVASRAIEAGGTAGAGRADSLGGRRAARRWLLAGGGSNQSLDEIIVVQNPGPGTASVSISGLGGGQEVRAEKLQEVKVEPGRRLVFRVGEHLRRSSLPVLVRSTSPVVTERSAYGVGRSGRSATVGIPLE